MSLTVVKDLRAQREPPTAEEIEALETDVLSGFVLARSSAGWADSTVRGDVRTLNALRSWLSKPLWEMDPNDADRYFGKHLKSAAKQTKRSAAATISIFFTYLEKRHYAELYNLTGRAPESPIDELNRPRGNQDTLIRIPPPEAVLTALFAHWRADLNETRKFNTEARDYIACRLMAMIGIRINETSKLDLDDINEAPELGRLPKLHIRYGKGAYGSGPKTRIVPLINGADMLLEWYAHEVRSEFDDPEHWSRPGAPLFCSERRHPDGSARRVGVSSLRQGLTDAVERYVPEWKGKITPHVLRHYCASELYRTGMDLIAIQELLGHEWIATTMRYVHVLRSHVEDSWVKASARTQRRISGAQS
jgi:site-specific recombinase XerD